MPEDTKNTEAQVAVEVEQVEVEEAAHEQFKENIQKKIEEMGAQNESSKETVSEEEKTMPSEAAKIEPSGKYLDDEDSSAVNQTEEEIPVEEDGKASEEDGDEEEVKVDHNLYEAAISLGFDEEEIVSMSKANVLSKTVLKLIRQEQNKNNTEKVSEVEEKDGEEYKLGLSEDEHDEGVIKEFKNLVDYFNKKLKVVEDKYASLKEKDIQNERDAFVDWFDKSVDGLGDEYNKLFGSSEEIRTKRGSAAEKNRSVLFDEMSKINNGYVQSKKTIDRAVLLKKALYSAFGDDIIKINNEKLIKKGNNISKMQSNKVSSFKTSNINPEKATEMEIAEYLKKNGLLQKG
ncbi:MAG: hypothetical protein PHH82_04925 [Candidatus ainarchaeum sp.]|nr:hypothetical protein [Candidatus ainarchaeum sp.]